MELKRRKFQGVLNILSFNRHFYVYGLATLCLVLVGCSFLELSFIWFWVITLVFLYGLMAPLIVSAYVYDFSGYYDFEWLKKCGFTNVKPQTIVNINAGFDETSFILKDHFPQSELKVFDFYNSENHTELAIVRARKVSLTYPNTQQITTNHIPLEDDSVDAVFLLSAIHEIRSDKEKIEFLKECDRICKPKGKVVMVEHLRDLHNFLAFSVGFTHFFSKKTWINVFKKAGFGLVDETKFTPFMSIFVTSPKKMQSI